MITAHLCSVTMLTSARARRASKLPPPRPSMTERPWYTTASRMMLAPSRRAAASIVRRAERAHSTQNLSLALSEQGVTGKRLDRAAGVIFREFFPEADFQIDSILSLRTTMLIDCKRSTHAHAKATSPLSHTKWSSEGAAGCEHVGHTATHHRRPLRAGGCPVHTRALLTLTCTYTGHLSLRDRGGCMPGACPTTLTLTHLVVRGFGRAVLCLSVCLSVSNPNPNQGAPTRLPLLRGGASIHTIATRAASLSRSRAGGHCTSVPSAHCLSSWRSLRGHCTSIPSGHCTSMPSGHCTSVWRFNIECTCARW